MWESIPLGIQANIIQYMGIAYRIALTRTNLPSLDKYLWYHMLRCFSTLVISHVQSAIYIDVSLVDNQGTSTLPLKAG